MNAFQYVDIKFQEASIAISKMNSASYDLKTGGQAKALQMVLGWLRTYYKWAAVPGIVYGFLMVKVGAQEAPVSPLIPKAAPDLNIVNTPGQANDQEPQTSS